MQELLADDPALGYADVNANNIDPDENFADDYENQDFEDFFESEEDKTEAAIDTDSQPSSKPIFEGAPHKYCDQHASDHNVCCASCIDWSGCS